MLLIKHSRRYKAPIWIIVHLHTHAYAHSYKSIHNTFWQSYSRSSPCLSSPAPLQGADVWGQLTLSANFCVQSKQQNSALLAAKGNLLLKGGGVGFGVNVKYHEDRRQNKHTLRRGCTQVKVCQGCDSVLLGKIPHFLRRLKRSAVAANVPVASRSIRQIKQSGFTTCLIIPDPSVYLCVLASLVCPFQNLQTSIKWRKTRQWAFTGSADAASRTSARTQEQLS